MDTTSTGISTDMLDTVARVLQQETSPRGRTVLTVLYLFVLSMCFLVPFFFYARMHCDERRNRHVREMEIATIAQALSESQTVQTAAQREESRATRRKYREERRAQILQLFGPVRMILKEENFVNEATADRISKSHVQESLSFENSTSKNEDCTKNDLAVVTDMKSPSRQQPGNKRTKSCEKDEEEQGNILIPEPGLPMGSLLDFLTSSSNSSRSTSQGSSHSDKQDGMVTTRSLRQVPNECSICLCEYTVGSDIVWSSNPQCDHAFHEQCIEQWLMKQREGPLCPCCRRDFVIDPFDDVEAFVCETEQRGTSQGGADTTIQTIDSDIMSDPRTW
ncbi:ring finger domain containing protein [Nitzschia inconspicua]|uniref:Ring finger domain containing protein n=1 Tax=Nitzschia inconspicua TaxID=303405 RepID=A0A9K3LV11_9STRA|nr:ring finger domain containing protein [Nitzschia inconspicua]